MLAKIQSWGNSQGIRFNKHILSAAHIEVGDEVEISVEEGEIILRRLPGVRGKYDLKALAKKMPKSYRPSEEDWGPAKGKEIW